MMIIHGLADDNVVVAHTLRFSVRAAGGGLSALGAAAGWRDAMTPQEVVAENLLLLQSDFLQEALGRRRPRAGAANKC